MTELDIVDQHYFNMCGPDQALDDYHEKCNAEKAKFLADVKQCVSERLAEARKIDCEAVIAKISSLKPYYSLATTQDWDRFKDELIQSIAEVYYERK